MRQDFIHDSDDVISIYIQKNNNDVSGVMIVYILVFIWKVKNVCIDDRNDDFDGTDDLVLFF